MKPDQFYKIKGYLEGLSKLITFFGVCYGHEYRFVEIEQPIERAVEHYNTNSNLTHHKDIKFTGLREIENWKDELFNSTFAA